MFFYKHLILLTLFSLSALSKSLPVMTDHELGLMIQREGSQELTWGEADLAGTAQFYCRYLTLEDHKDWRLPNLDELTQLADKYSAEALNVREDQIFWSLDAYENEAWAVYLSRGSAVVLNKKNQLNVRCVRSLNQQ